METILFKSQFIESVSFMVTSLSNLVDNLEGIHKTKCKCGHDNKKCKR